MISKQEVKYFNSLAKDVPFPGTDYAYDVINRLSKALNIFKSKYDGKTYNILLSDGEEITFEMQSRYLAHLLGIDYKTLVNDENMKKLLYDILGFEDDNQINSYSVLCRIVENGDRVIDNDELSFDKILNYYKIMSKVSCFECLAGFNEFNFGYLAFDKKIFERRIGNNFTPNSVGYIFSKTEEKFAPLCMMGLKYDNYLDAMIPETFITPPNFADYLYCQELLLPIQLVISDDINLTKLSATPEEKIRLLNWFKSLIKTYDTNSFINVFGDYEMTLNEMATKRKILK